MGTNYYSHGKHLGKRSYWEIGQTIWTASMLLKDIQTMFHNNPQEFLVVDEEGKEYTYGELLEIIGRCKITDTFYVGTDFS